MNSTGVYAIDDAEAVIPPLPSVTESIVVGIRVTVITYLVITVAFLVWDVYTALPGKSSWVTGRRAHRPLWKLRLLILAQTLMNIALFLLVAIQVYWIPYTPGEYSCTLVVRFGTLSYAISVQLVLFTLVVRCNLVEGLIKTKLFLAISAGTKFAIAVFIPLVFFSTISYFVEGHVTSCGLCLLVNIAPPVMLYVFLIGNTLLTVATTYLFYAPINASIRAVNPSNAESLKQTMWRNVYINSIAMICQIICSALFWHLNTGRQSPDWENGANLTLSVIFPCTDCFILSLCARLMVSNVAQGSRRSQIQEDQTPHHGHRTAAEMSTLPTPATVQATHTGTMVPY